MTRLVIGISGGIATGKSTFIRALANRLGAATTGFGDYVRAEAAMRNLDASSRDVLQQLGEQLKRDLGDDAFVQRVLAHVPAHGHLIIDGIRHAEIADSIQRVSAPRRFVLMFLDADEQTRRARAESSRPADASRLDELAAHSTERQVHDGSVRARADLVLDATKPVDTLVEEALAFLAL
jgi:dephospho-CoA kinase